MPTAVPAGPQAIAEEPSTAAFSPQPCPLPSTLSWALVPQELVQGAGRGRVCRSLPRPFPPALSPAVPQTPWPAAEEGEAREHCTGGPGRQAGSGTLCPCRQGKLRSGATLRVGHGSQSLGPGRTVAVTSLPAPGPQWPREVPATGRRAAWSVRCDRQTPLPTHTPRPHVHTAPHTRTHTSVNTTTGKYCSPAAAPGRVSSSSAPSLHSVTGCLSPWPRAQPFSREEPRGAAPSCAVGPQLGFTSAGARPHPGSQPVRVAFPEPQKLRARSSMDTE